MTASRAQQGVDIGAKLLGEFVNDAYTLRMKHTTINLNAVLILLFTTLPTVSPQQN